MSNECPAPEDLRNICGGLKQNLHNCRPDEANPDWHAACAVQLIERIARIEAELGEADIAVDVALKEWQFTQQQLAAKDQRNAELKATIERLTAAVSDEDAERFGHVENEASTHFLLKRLSAL
jgi:predicted ArsR family transcriptional regulator